MLLIWSLWATPALDIIHDESDILLLWIYSVTTHQSIHIVLIVFIVLIDLFYCIYLFCVSFVWSCLSYL